LALGLAVLLLALAGCVTAQPTPYQPATEGQGGYSGQEIAPDRVRVTFSGNSATPREMVENALLYRAAEVTVHRGYDYFIVVEQDTERFTQYGYSGPRTSLRLGYGHGFGCCRRSGPFARYRYGWGPWDPWDPWGPGWGDPYYGRPVVTGHRYKAHAVVALRRGPVPVEMADAYDARAVMATLGPSIPRPVPPAPASPGAPVPGIDAVPAPGTPDNASG
jgi:hypothetical protein